MADLVEAGEVYFELSMLEGVGGIANLLGKLPSSASSLVPMRRCSISIRATQAEGVAPELRKQASDPARKREPFAGEKTGSRKSALNLASQLER